MPDSVQVSRCIPWRATRPAFTSFHVFANAGRPLPAGGPAGDRAGIRCLQTEQFASLPSNRPGLSRRDEGPVDSVPRMSGVHRGSLRSASRMEPTGRHYRDDTMATTTPHVFPVAKRARCSRRAGRWWRAAAANRRKCAASTPQNQVAAWSICLMSGAGAGQNWTRSGSAPLAACSLLR
jgi:hypothetical protein